MSLILLLAGAATATSAQAPEPSQQPGQTAALEDKASTPISPLTPLISHTADEPYEPITSRQRLHWFLSETAGPAHLLGGGIISSAIGTGLDRPEEYGSSWGGFGDRFGMRMTGISTGNAMEASVGAIWGEDPRYFRVPEKSFGERLANVAKQTVLARRRNGEFAPAYARYIAVPGNNFLSNTWRVHSEANTDDALLRTAEGFGGRMISNAWEEFWPGISSHLFHRGN
jgi:hypothetical protein